MSYSHVEIKSFLGVYLQRNSFSTPDGALEQANNCILKRDGIIEKRPGFYTFLSPSGGTTLNNLGLYQSTLMGLYTTKIQSISAGGTGTDLIGEAISVTGGRVGRFFEANNNLYFTTDNGVMKIESNTGTIYKSGVPPALDLVGTFAAANGPIGGDTQVNYRVVFIRRDANNNLVLGSPSDFLTLINRKISGATWSRSGAGPYTVTVTTVAPHNLVTNMVINVSAFSSTVGNGSQTVTVTGANTFTWSQAVDPGAASGTLDFTATRNTQLEFSIPSEIQSTVYSYQIYRSSQSSDSSTAAALDFSLIQEASLTTTNITNRVIYFTDAILDIFRGAELYTNPNSREGELQAAARAPLCSDVTSYKNYAFYSDCTYRHNLPLNLVSTSTTYITATDYIELKLGGTTRRYVARGGVGNASVRAESVSGTGTITVTYTAHGLATGDMVYISNVTGTFTEGTYTVGTVAANTFQVTGSGTPSALTFQGVTNGTYPIFQLVAPSTSVAAGIDATARALVKAINRDSSSPVYARYVSTAQTIPGQLALESKSFAGVFQARASSTTAGGAFYPALPSSFGTVNSTADTLPNVVAYSKVGEPEAVPTLNRLPVGARNKKILRIFALRDSLIVVKEDGVYRIDGDSPSNFSATILDSTIICLTGSSAVTLNNQVYLLSNQGYCAISNSSVQIISRKIEDPVTPTFSYSQTAGSTFAIAYESARLYLVTTLLPNTTTPSVVWCYNSLTDEWTTWDKTFAGGIVGPSDTLYMISTGNKILKERKNQNRTDYADEAYAMTVTSVATDKKSAIINVPGYTAKVGDIIVLGTGLTRIRSLTSLGSNNYAVTFDYQTTLKAADAATVYQGYTATVKLAPYHAGQTNRAKQFAQMQIHTKDDTLTTLDISFQGDTFGGSEVTTWRASNIGGFGGWGQFPWGFVPWGQESGINLNYETKAAAIIRIILPLFAQRTSFIQPVLVHSNAGEPMNIQSLGFQVRGYGERVSR